MKKEFLIWSNEHMSWWGKDRFGYTKYPTSAGIYTLDEAKEICYNANLYAKDGVPDEFMVHISDIKELKKENTK